MAMMRNAHAAVDLGMIDQFQDCVYVNNSQYGHLVDMVDESFCA
jgi:hypothetical protein